MLRLFGRLDALNRCPLYPLASRTAQTNIISVSVENLARMIISVNHRQLNKKYCDDRYM